MNDIPRRCDTLRDTPAEKAIRDALSAVEGVGAHPLLTDAVVLLDQARNKVADYVDMPPAETTQQDDAKAARIRDDKLLRAKLRDIELHLKKSPIRSAERTLAFRAVQQSKHWLGEDLREAEDGPYPYPNSSNPQNTKVDPAAP